MSLLSSEDVDENKSKSCIILEIGRYLCHNGIREFLYSRRPSFDKTIAYLIFFSYVLVLKIRAYHLLFDKIFYTSKSESLDERYDIPCTYTDTSILARGNLHVMHRCTLAYLYTCIAKRMSRERFWKKWLQNGSAYRARNVHTLKSVLSDKTNNSIHEKKHLFVVLLEWVI